MADHAEITEIDINPLLCDPQGVIAVDCRIRVRAATVSGAIAAWPSGPIRSSWRARSARPRGSPTPCVRSSRKTSRRCAALPTKSTRSDLWHAFFAPLRDRTHETAARLEPDRLRPRDDAGRLGRRARGGAGALDRRSRLRRRRNVRSSSAPTCGKRAWRGNYWTRFCARLPSRAVRQAVLIFPADQTRMLNLSTDLGFEVAVSPTDASQVRATKVLRMTASQSGT